MEFQESIAAIYSEAKSEYTKQLIFNFQPVLLRFFLDRYTEVKTNMSLMANSKSALRQFQESLSQIPEWNLDKVQRETSILLDKVSCDYIEDLITAVFIAHTKILSAISLQTKPRRVPIKITIPKPDHFMHRAMAECSRLMWSNVYLFDDSTSSLDRQKNMNNVNSFLEAGILQAIRNLLPVKSILRDSLQEEEDEGVRVVRGGAADLEKDTDGPDEIFPEPVIAKAVQLKPTESVPLDQVKPAQQVKPVDAFSTIPSLYPTLPASPTLAGPEPSNTLIVDTEKSVGFTGMDSVFGDSGHAELRPTIEEDEEAFKIIGDSEELDADEIEDLDAADEPISFSPLSSDDYEPL